MAQIRHNGPGAENEESSKLAERKGFEPLIRLPVRQISSLATRSGTDCTNQHDDVKARTIGEPVLSFAAPAAAKTLIGGTNPAQTADPTTASILGEQHAFAESEDLALAHSVACRTRGAL